jgi:hypothetical protein
MAQQTQAARAGEAWLRFMDAFPTATTLASAAPADVLRAWQGLGYNRRALNLWRAARRIVEVHDGRVPSDPGALEALPGVGPYTARAVAAIAFGLPVGAVDTNVRRVLGRIMAGGGGVPGSAAMQVLADACGSGRPAGSLDARGDGPRGDGLPAATAGLWSLSGRFVVPLRGHVIGGGSRRGRQAAHGQSGTSPGGPRDRCPLRGDVTVAPGPDHRTLAGGRRRVGDDGRADRDP